MTQTALNRSWFEQTARHQSSALAQQPGASPPFKPADFQIRHRIGAGLEQTVYRFPPSTILRNLVIKETRQTLPPRARLMSRLLMPGGQLDGILTWPEIAAIKQRDNETIRRIMSAHVLSTRYIHGHASDGRALSTNYCVQERIDGRSLYAAMQGNQQEVLDDRTIREALLEIVWGSKRVLIELGATPDFYKGDNILVTRDRRVVLNDTGFPSFLAAGATAVDLPTLLRLYFVRVIEFHLRYMLHLERLLKPASHECQCLNSRYGVSESAFNTKVQALARIRYSALRNIPSSIFRQMGIY